MAPIRYYFSTTSFAILTEVEVSLNAVECLRDYLFLLFQNIICVLR